MTADAMHDARPMRKEVAMHAEPIECRFRSGQSCRDAGQYCFDGFVDASARSLPPPEQRVSWVERSAPFPLSLDGRPCWWVPVGDEPSLADDVGLEAISARCLG